MFRKRKEARMDEIKKIDTVVKKKSKQKILGRKNVIQYKKFSSYFFDFFDFLISCNFLQATLMWLRAKPTKREAERSKVYTLIA